MKTTCISLARTLLFFVFFLTGKIAITQSLRFTDTTYIDLGNAPSLHLTNFTLEAWVKIEGYGSTTETGANGITGVIPVITKGRAQSEDAATDVNYFLGVKRREAPLNGYQLVADFEDNTAPGTSPNFPATSTGIILPCVWTHVAVSYNTTTGDWKFYINGAVTNTINYPSKPVPESGSNVNACIGSSLNNSTGIRPGFFNGRIDEVRIWNIARTDAEILSNYNSEITTAPNLAGRWSLNEASGTAAANSANGDATSNGTIVNEVRWVTGYNQTDATTNASMDFNGVHDYVTFGTASTLNTSTTVPAATGFTLEAWIKIEGSGVATSTGTGGLAAAIPLIAKGRGESDASGLNMNYFIGITSGNILVADFEEAAGANTGLNHPVTGSASAAVPANTWSHVAATYNITDGMWNLYLNGVNVGSLDLTNGIIPENISTQHASIGTALTSNGTPAGFFNGKIDEVRIWKVARTASEILASYQAELTSGTGLLGRFGFNENCDTVINNSVSGNASGVAKSYQQASNPITTTLHPTNGGPSWVSSGFNNVAPSAPTNPSPANNGNSATLNPSLCATVADPNGGNITARFYGRPKPTGGSAPFTIVLIPDTQFYTSEMNGGTIAMFNAQTAWITNNRASKNIVYAGQLGDCVQNGDDQPIEWTRAVNAMATIESPVLTGLPQGLPFGICVGNHDQSVIGDPTSPSFYYNQHFGETHFTGRNYYGGHYGTNNDNHFQLFSASGIDFLVISLEFDGTAAFATGPVLDWAEALVQTYASRKVIVMTHNLINESAAFSTQGQAIFNRLSPYTNVIMLHGGHVSSFTGGEAMRADVVNGRTLYSILTDYQSRINGGNGLLRYYEFNPLTNTVQAKTYSPHALLEETDANSQFTFTMNLNNFVLLGQTTVNSGGSACLSWPGLNQSTQYEWYVEVSDVESTTTGPVWTFTTPTNVLLPVTMVSFTASPETNKVKLLWTTIYESNNSHFTVQRSADGINFSDIGIVQGINNANRLQDYIYYDEAPIKGTSYYRLKQTDLNNLFTLSEIERVKFDLPGNVDVYPNPVHGKTFTIQFPNSLQAPVEIRVYDMKGVLQLQRNNIAVNTLQVTHDLAPGLYVIQITGKAINEHKKLVIQ